MKVILQKDVAKLGRRHTVVEVPDGYAQNKLIPQGMATPATPENLKRIKHVAAEAAAHTAADESAFRAALKQLLTTVVNVTVDANEQGHLFKAVKAGDIHAALVAAGVTGIPLNAIMVADPIKTCGEHTIATRFHAIEETITVAVVAK